MRSRFLFGWLVFFAGLFVGAMGNIIFAMGCCSRSVQGLRRSDWRVSETRGGFRSGGLQPSIFTALRVRTLRVLCMWLSPDATLKGAATKPGPHEYLATESVHKSGFVAVGFGQASSRRYES